MNRYTATTDFAFSDARDSRSLIVSGSVTLHCFDGVDWIEGETLTTGSYEVFTKGLQLRVELVSGDAFSIDTATYR